VNSRSTRFQSLVDLVSEDPENISSIGDFETVKAIIFHIAPPVTRLEWLLKRIMESMYPSQLLALLPDIYGRKAAQLKSLAEALGEKDMDLPEDALETIADTYWTVEVRERIVRKDYRRAWDEVRHAFYGFMDEAFTPEQMLHSPIRNQNHMGASLECIEGLINDLYAALLAENLVPEDPWFEKVVVKFNDAFSKPAGILFATAIHGYHKHDRTFMSVGMRVIRISEYVNKVRNKKREQKFERKMGEQFPQS
jgi:hypothetical protein